MTPTPPPPRWVLRPHPPQRVPPAAKQSPRQCRGGAGGHHGAPHPWVLTAGRGSLPPPSPGKPPEWGEGADGREVQPAGAHPPSFPASRGGCHGLESPLLIPPPVSPPTLPVCPHSLPKPHRIPPPPPPRPPRPRASPRWGSAASAPTRGVLHGAGSGRGGGSRAGLGGPGPGGDARGRAGAGAAAARDAPHPPGCWVLSASRQRSGTPGTARLSPPAPPASPGPRGGGWRLSGARGDTPPPRDGGLPAHLPTPPVPAVPIVSCLSFPREPSKGMVGGSSTSGGHDGGVQRGVSGRGGG